MKSAVNLEVKTGNYETIEEIKKEQQSAHSDRAQTALGPRESLGKCYLLFADLKFRA